MNWSLAKAKDNFSEVVRRAASEGPQGITVHGEETAVVISKADFDLMQSADTPRSFKDWLRSMNFDGVDLSRDQTPARDVDL